MSRINMGDRVKDRITGLKGIVTGLSQFLYGCSRVMVQPEEHKDGKPHDPVWIDEAQAELVKASVIEGYPAQPKKIGPAGPRADHVARQDARR